MEVPFDNSRMKREWKTVNTMIKIYCDDHHSSKQNGSDFCNNCQELSDYAEEKLSKCRFQANKPTCANCPVHCYRKSKAREIKEVMRYAGPKMVFKHPVMAIRHLFDGRRDVELPVN